MIVCGQEASCCTGDLPFQLWQTWYLELASGLSPFDTWLWLSEDSCPALIFDLSSHNETLSFETLAGEVTLRQFRDPAEAQLVRYASLYTVLRTCGVLKSISGTMTKQHLFYALQTTRPVHREISHDKRHVSDTFVSLQALCALL